MTDPARDGARPSVLIVSFSRIVADARVLKQVKLLSGHYDVTTCGHGPRPEGVVGHVEIPEQLQAWRKDPRWIVLRRYRAVYAANEAVSFARAHLPSGTFDVVFANDVEAVGLALDLRPRHGVHADLHEYAPGQNTELLRWRLFVAPYLRWLCRAHVARADSVTTVGPAIARRYAKELGIEVGVVMNATPRADLAPGRTTDEGPLRLVHSGNAMRSRGIGTLIEAVEASSAPVTLDLYLMPNEPDHLADLKAAAAASKRVRVLDPVPYADLVARLHEYDVGLHVLPPINFNNLWALPNKVFDYVQARLGVVVGPSPEMAAIVTARGLGAVADAFDAAALTRVLDGLDGATVRRWQAASDENAKELSGEVQSEGWLVAVKRLLGEDGPATAERDRGAMAQETARAAGPRGWKGRLRGVALWAAKRVPPRARTFAIRATTALPVGLEERVMRLASGPAAIPPPVDVPATPVRLYIAPANYAGQAFRWARAVEEHLDGVGARNTATVTGYGYPADRAVPALTHTLSRRWQARERDAVRRFTHVIIEAERPLFPRLGDGDPFTEARDLAARGLRVAMLSHGSDLRSPSAHAARSPWSPFTDPDWKDVPVLEERTRHNGAGLAALHEEGIPLFVPTSDLLLDAPYATWCPITIDPVPWRHEAPPMERRVPVVVHAPSHGVIKGSAVVESVLTGLAARGLIEYRRAQGIPHREMIAFYQDADVIVDQLRIGNYATAACEAMAAGRVVVSHVDEQVRGHVRAETGREIPIVEANPDTLEEVVVRLVEDREEARAAAARGPAFVDGLHDGLGAARALSGFLGRPLG